MTSKNPDLQREHHVVSLAEEELRVEKREVTTGKVRVQTFVDSFEEVARASLGEEHVERDLAERGLDRLFWVRDFGTYERW